MYQTIVLELLQAQPVIHERLRSERKLHLMQERYAKELQATHEAWRARRSAALPDSDASQIASEALELAVAGLLERLQLEFSTAAISSVSLDEAVVFVRRHTPPE